MSQTTRRPRLPKPLSDLLGWINAAGLLPQAMAVVQDKDADTAFCHLHEAMRAGNLCPQAMRLFDDCDEDDCWLLTNELVLLAYRQRNGVAS